MSVVSDPKLLPNSNSLPRWQISQKRGSTLTVEDRNVSVYNLSMTIELPSVVEEQLRDLAKKQNRDVATVIEDAVRQYIDAAAITDVDLDQIAETQATLLCELPPISKWETDDA